jgi:hypothetical protein
MTRRTEREAWTAATKDERRPDIGMVKVGKRVLMLRPQTYRLLELQATRDWI